MYVCISGCETGSRGGCPWVSFAQFRSAARPAGYRCSYYSSKIGACQYTHGLTIADEKRNCRVHCKSCWASCFWDVAIQRSSCNIKPAEGLPAWSMAHHHADSDGEGAAAATPEKGALYAAWESRPLIREQLRCNKKLLVWPSVQTTGVASMAALKCNRLVIADVINVWGKFCSEPKSPPVAWLRSEAPSINGSCFLGMQSSC